MTTHPFPSRSTGLANEDTVPSVDRLLEESLRARPSSHHRTEPDRLLLRGGSIYPTRESADEAGADPVDVDEPRRGSPPSGEQAASVPPPEHESGGTPRRHRPRLEAIALAAFALGSLTTIGLLSQSPEPSPVVVLPEPVASGVSRASMGPRPTFASEPPVVTCDPAFYTDSVVSLEIDVPRLASASPAPAGLEPVLRMAELHVRGRLPSTAAEAPTPAPRPKEADLPGAFDHEQANASLAAVAASAQRRCADRAGRAALEVTFAPSGRVTTAVVVGGSLRGTAAGSCVARAARNASVSTHRDGYVTVRRVIRLEDPIEPRRL